MENVESGCHCCCWTILGVVLFLVVLLSRSNTFLRYHGKFWSYYVTVSTVSLGSIPFFIFNRHPHVKNSWHSLYLERFLGYVSCMLGVTWELRSSEILKEERGCVIMVNHQCSLDTLGIMMKWVDIGKLAPVVRKELWYFWPYGLVLWLGNTVFIDRHQPAKAKVQLKTAIRRVKDKNKLIFFPEGTRNHDGDSLLPFKKGAFHVAVTCQVPIVPIVYSPYYFINHKEKRFGSGRVIMQVLPPIPTEGLTEADINDLMERTRNSMLETYKKLSEEVKMAAKQE